MAYLQRATDALATAPGTALALANEHSKRFPHGTLSEQRERVAIEALILLGRTDEARARAAPMLAATPKSVFAHRIEVLLGQAAPASQKSTSNKKDADLEIPTSSDGHD